ncbi:unnamed protein product [Caenorhabditis angaria]|uniref:Uncharacterized protein n=1 Tax=Caenorhabditis angaria TaxID=860376 RepID=A0A9P1IBV3_9PELO|nr:unnamed protein product [Caenorhabditis angaria]
MLGFLVVVLTVPMMIFGCRDGKHNVLTIDSYGNKSLPIQVKNVKLLVYDHEMKPSCYKNKVNIVLPGYFVLVGGEIETSRNFDVIKSGPTSLSVSLDGDNICLEGKSDMFIVPNSLCHFELASFVPVEICKIIQKKGTHTIKEIEEFANFNSTIELPPSPSFLGISLLEVLKGDYRIKVSIASEGEKIVEFSVPTGYVNLKMGMSEGDDED